MLRVNPSETETLFVHQEEVIGVFTAPELQLLCCGTPTVDWRELKLAFTYDHDELGMLRNSESVQWFWQTVEDMMQPEVGRRRSLIFAA